MDLCSFLARFNRLGYRRRWSKAHGLRINAFFLFSCQLFLCLALQQSGCLFIYRFLSPSLSLSLSSYFSFETDSVSGFVMPASDIMSRLYFLLLQRMLFVLRSNREWWYVFIENRNSLWRILSLVLQLLLLTAYGTDSVGQPPWPFVERITWIYFLQAHFWIETCFVTEDLWDEIKYKFVFIAVTSC
jgi:hypothetical protein